MWWRKMSRVYMEGAGMKIEIQSHKYGGLLEKA
jgi:hypothetical protein